MIDKHPNKHPLVILFGVRKFTTQAGIDWLQERGHISDLCRTPQDVAPCDVERVLTKAGAWFARHDWRKFSLQKTSPSGNLASALACEASQLNH